MLAVDKKEMKEKNQFFFGKMIATCIVLIRQATCD